MNRTPACTTVNATIARLAAATLAALVAVAQPLAAGADGGVNTSFWVTDGEVYAVALTGNTLYIGGSFTHVSPPPTGTFAALDAQTGSPSLTLPPVSGRVYAIEPDAKGGWYIGGDFYAVGGYPIRNLAHILADGNLDFNWLPALDNELGYGEVNTLVLSDNTIYVLGRFTRIGGQVRHNIAALDATTGLATAWDAGLSGPYFPYSVYAYAIAVTGATVYVAGEFTVAGGQARTNIAALDATTGRATNWNPDPPTSIVVALAVSGNNVYIGGAFNYVGAQRRNYIAALDATTGHVTHWNPNAIEGDELPGFIRFLVVSGNTVYASGMFAGIGGQERRYLAALDAVTGLATPWDPKPSSHVYALAVNGNTVYVGGDFYHIGGQARENIAALDATTGIATAWDPGAHGRVLALKVYGNTVYTGGDFVSFGGYARSHIAALDVTTGRPTAWNPNVDGTVNQLVVSGTTIYIGGEFNLVGGQARNRIAAIDSVTGLATGWNPSANNVVDALSVNNNRIYVGGQFTRIGGQARNYIAALDTTTGLATAWDPNADSFVSALSVNSDKVYVAGRFGHISGLGRSFIAALDATTGRATAWDPNADSFVSALSVNDNRIYVGGQFTRIGGQARNYIAAFDAQTGLAAAWNPYISSTLPNSGVRVLSAHGETIYVGGFFTSIGGQFRNNLAALDATTGRALAWDPGAYAYTLVVSGATIYLGGFFDSPPQHGIVMLRASGATTHCQSAASGRWTLSTNWSTCGNTTPMSGDSVTVRAGDTITLYQSANLDNLTVAGNLDIPSGVTLTVERAITNTGALRQALFAPASQTAYFLDITNFDATIDRYLGMEVTPSGDMGYTSVAIHGDLTACPISPDDPLIRRCYDIQPGQSQTATLRFYYTHADLNGQPFDQLKLWRWSNGWTQVGDAYNQSATCNPGQTNCWFQADNVGVVFTSTFALGAAGPTLQLAAWPPAAGTILLPGQTISYAVSLRDVPPPSGLMSVDAGATRRAARSPIQESAVITASIPDGTVLVPGSISPGTVVSGSVLMWSTSNLDAGHPVTATYAVQVATIYSPIVNQASAVTADAPQTVRTALVHNEHTILMPGLLKR